MILVFIFNLIPYFTHPIVSYYKFNWNFFFFLIILRYGRKPNSLVFILLVVIMFVFDTIALCMIMLDSCNILDDIQNR